MESFEMPAVWNDDDTMFDLMQPIRRPRHIDPDTYDRKITFWLSLVSEYCRSKRVLVVSIPALSAVFSRYFAEEQTHMSPACLGEVLRVLESSGDIKPCSQSSLVSILRKGFRYILKLPFSLFSDESSEKCLDHHASGHDCDSLFVFQKLVDVLLEEFLAHFKVAKMEKRLILSLPAYELSEFESSLAEFFPHDLTRNYIRTLCIKHYHCVEVVRADAYGPLDASDLVWVSEQSRVPVSTFSKSDKAKSNFSALIGLARLRAAISHQEHEETLLSAKLNDRRCELKALLHAKRLREAKTLLKRIKLLEQALERKQSQIQHLEALQLQIVSSSDNQTILHTLAESSKVLKQITGGRSGVDLVEDTMADLAESFQETSDVSEIICSLGRTTLLEATDDELESELRNLSKSSAPESGSLTAISSCTEDLDAQLSTLQTDNLVLPEAPTSRGQSSGRSQRSSEMPLIS